MWRSMSAGSILKDSSISAHTGSAPANTIALKHECQVQDGRITSSPGPTSSAASAHCRAAVPEVTPSAYFAPSKILLRVTRNAFEELLLRNVASQGLMRQVFLPL